MSPLYDFSALFERLTDNAKGSLEHADNIARGMGTSYIGTEHLLLGLLSQTTSVGGKLLNTAGITLDRARLALKLTPKVMVGNTQAKGLSEAAKLTLKMSWEIAQEFGQEFCGTEHILFSLINQSNSRAYRLLNDMGADVNQMRDELEQYINSQQFNYEGSTSAQRKKGRRSSLVDRYGIDLTDKASQGKLDPMIGRANELERIITILARRQKNNPVLIGEPGVGKTAVVEGLAQRIMDEQVPDSLLDKRIVTIDLAGMIAGTKYRGEFEERLKKMISELTNDKQTIIFIDEVHLLVGAGAAEGAIDAGNILKPALARGAIRVIGATTLDEYRKHIESDAALERRLQTIVVDEATRDESIQILRGLRSHYEDFHGVAMNDETIEHAVRLATRYINDRRLPDKAIDLIDEASASVRIQRGKIPAEERKVQRQLKAANNLMEEAVQNEDYQRAALHKSRIAELSKKIEKLQKERRKKSKLRLTTADVDHVISRITGIPLKKLDRIEAKQLINLEKILGKHVIGQDEAIQEVSKAIRRNRSGISSEKRPIGSFVFMGPSGVGKTELARVIARELFHDESSLIKIDMSEFSERHNVSRLVGAPAGYVGYEDAGQLTDTVRRRPYSVILFDEIEKAHPDLFNILLQILEDGTLTDAKGRKVDFSSTIIIMTSNLGAHLLQKEADFGFAVGAGKKDESKLDELHEENVEKVTSELKNLMRPELINRIDKTIVFRPLTKKEVRKILDLQLSELNERVNLKKYGLEITPAAKKLLIEKGYDPQNGVRPLRRAIQDLLEDKIAHSILSQEFKQGDIIKADSKKKEIILGATNEYQTKKTKSA